MSSLVLHNYVHLPIATNLCITGSLTFERSFGCLKAIPEREEKCFHFSLLLGRRAFKETEFNIRAGARGRLHTQSEMVVRLEELYITITVAKTLAACGKVDCRIGLCQATVILTVLLSRSFSLSLSCSLLFPFLLLSQSLPPLAFSLFISLKLTKYHSLFLPLPLPPALPPPISFSN